MKRIARRAASRFAPGLLAERGRRYERNLRQRIGLTGLAEEATERSGDLVLDGPFAGMRLPDGWEAVTTSPVLMLLGTYEAPIHAAIEAAIARKPRTIVNVGCGSGYYTVGLAIRVPGARVRGYDIARGERLLTGRLARENDVSDRVEVKARCRQISRADLIVCDIDGGEDALLPPAAPRLGTTTLIVEAHDQFVPGVTERLISAFESTHTVEVVEDEPRARAAALDWMTDEQATLALDEMRADQPGRWLVMTP